MGEHDEQFVFEMGYNKGFKDGIKGSIPKAEIKKFLEEGTKDVGNNVLAIVREDYIHKADYEKRLKADMVAMLTEIQLECEENTVRWYVGRVDGKSDDVVLMETINDIIQQKINALKAESEDNK